MVLLVHFTVKNLTCTKFSLYSSFGFIPITGCPTIITYFGLQQESWPYKSLILSPVNKSNHGKHQAI